ncbi:hypothetical protein [Pseudomonas nitroreducens]|uniref:hypothetical protein n=1 Tax=Pseudomonas nitroreducens TaxID=46680 RepID=UPI002657F8B3|nr:hypothetical protein [Pseudomonas nitroreducens]MCP1647230.1 hypothetical protein [Pseudomonas nitroreducens]MCP1685806.1 hypothetical protein [Pseudomonas nitroreducens]
MANRSINSSIGYISFSGLLLSMLFPWTQLTKSFESDIQPYSLIIATPITIIFLAAKSRDLKTGRIGLGCLLAALLGSLIIITIILIDGIDAESLRGAYQYAYATILFLLTYSLSKINLHNKKNIIFIQRILILSFIVWVFVGAYQLLIDKNFLTSLVKRSVVTSDRGAISLSSEPAYFGQTLIFYSMSFYLLNKSKLSLLSLILAPTLTMSSVAAIVITVILSIYLLSRYKSKSIFFIPLIALLITYTPYLTSALSEVTDTRIFYLLDKLTQEGAYILLDGSLNIRITHFYYSHLGFISDFGIPHGTKYWPRYIDSRIGEFSLLWDSGTQQTNRINSGIGGVLFEGGIFSLGLLGAVFYILNKASKNRSELILFTGISITLMYTGYTFKTPFIYILITLLIIRRQPASTNLLKERII